MFINMTPNPSVDDILEQPSKGQLELIRDEINEDEDRLQHVENLLQSWIQCQPHFPKNSDKRVVRSFLRNCRHNLNKAKSKLEYNFMVRNLYPELYSNRSPKGKDVLHALDTINIVPLPRLSRNGNRVFIFKLEDPDPTKFDIGASSKLFFMIYDLLLTSHHPIAGDVAIFDGSDFGPHHFVKLLALLKMIITILRQAYSIRLKQVHVVNASLLADKIITVFKPFLNHKVRDNFVIHSDASSLSGYFGGDMMPSDYGGECKTVRAFMRDWTGVLNSHADWFLEQETVKITKSVPRKVEDTFFDRIEGSFRSLQVD